MEMEGTLLQAQEVQGYRGAFSTERCFTDSQTRSEFFFSENSGRDESARWKEKFLCPVPSLCTAEVTRKERTAGADPLTILASTYT